MMINGFETFAFYYDPQKDLVYFPLEKDHFGEIKTFWFPTNRFEIIKMNKNSSYYENDIIL